MPAPVSERVSPPETVTGWLISERAGFTEIVRLVFMVPGGDGGVGGGGGGDGGAVVGVGINCPQMFNAPVAPAPGVFVQPPAGHIM